MTPKLLLAASAVAAGVALLAPSLPAQASTGYTVSGVLLDASGNPLDGVDVGLMWGGARPTASDDPYEGLDESDASGAFSFTVPTSMVANGAWIWIGGGNNGGFVPSGVVRPASASAPIKRFSNVIIGQGGVRATYWQQVPRLSEQEFASGAVSTLAVTVPQAGSISGRSATLAGATLRLLDGAGATLRTVKGAAHTGAYAFDGLQAGTYRVAVQGAGKYLDMTSGALTVGAGKVVTYSPKVPTGASVAVRLLQGKKHLHSRVAVTLSRAGSVLEQHLTSTAGVVSFAGLKTGTYDVATKATSKFAAVHKRVVVRSLSKTVPAHLSLSRVAKLRGVISTSKGTSVVSVLSSAGKVVAHKTVRSGHRAYSFSGLRAGWYTVEVVRAGHLAKSKAHLIAGKTTSVRSRLAGKSLTLRGTVKGITSGTVTLVSGNQHWATRVAKGAFAFKGLPAAVYTVTTSAPGRQPKSSLVTLRKSTSKTLRVNPLAGSIVGTLKVAGTALSGAKVTLTGPKTVTTTTNPSGVLSVKGIVPGRYKISRIVPAQTIAPYWLSANAAIDVVTGKQFQFGVVNAVVKGS